MIKMTSSTVSLQQSVDQSFEGTNNYFSKELYLLRFHLMAIIWNYPSCSVTNKYIYSITNYYTGVQLRKTCFIGYLTIKMSDTLDFCHIKYERELWEI